MVYVRHKVIILFPYCEKCEEYKACKALAVKTETCDQITETPVLATA